MFPALARKSPNTNKLEPIFKIPPSSRCEIFSHIHKARRGSCSLSYNDEVATQRDEKIAATHKGYGQFPQYHRRLLLNVLKAQFRRRSLVLRKLIYIASGSILKMGSRTKIPLIAGDFSLWYYTRSSFTILFILNRKGDRMDIGRIKVFLLAAVILILLFFILLARSETVVAEGDFYDVIYLGDPKTELRGTLVYLVGGRQYVMGGDHYVMNYPQGTRIQIVKDGLGRYKIRPVNNIEKVN